MINEIMEYNKKFVEDKAYEPYLTSKYPDKKLAILTCMDTSDRVASGSAWSEKRRCKNHKKCRRCDHASIWKCGSKPFSSNY